MTPPMRPNALLLSVRLVAQGAWRLLASSWRRAAGVGQPGGCQTAPLSFFLVDALVLTMGTVFAAFVIEHLSKALPILDDHVLVWFFLTPFVATLVCVALVCSLPRFGYSARRPSPKTVAVFLGTAYALSAISMFFFGAGVVLDLLVVVSLCLTGLFLLLALALVLRATPSAVRRAHQAGLEGLSAHARLAAMAALHGRRR